MKELLSIKEFSKASGIEASTLRYWDKMGLFSPSKRGDNKYRYYSPDQIITVNFVNVLSNLNFPLKTVGDIESIRTPEAILDLIDQKESVLDAAMKKLREDYSVIHTRRDLIKGGVKADLAKVFVKDIPEKAFVLGPKNNFENGSFYEPFMHFCDQASDLRINLNFPIGGRHDSFEAFVERPSQPDNFFSIDPSGNSKSAKGKYLVGFCRGYYGKLGDLPERFAKYAEENKLKFIGPVYAVYLLDEICMKDPAQYLAEVFVAVAKKH